MACRACVGSSAAGRPSRCPRRRGAWSPRRSHVQAATNRQSAYREAECEQRCRCTPSRPVCTTAASSSPTDRSCAPSVQRAPRIVTRAADAVRAWDQARAVGDLITQARAIGGARSARSGARAAEARGGEGGGAGERAAAAFGAGAAALARSRRSRRRTRNCATTKRQQDEELAQQAQTMREFKRLQAQLHGERAELARERAIASRSSSSSEPSTRRRSRWDHLRSRRRSSPGRRSARVAELESASSAAAASAAAAAAAGRDGAEAATERELDAVSAALEATLAGVRGTVDEFARRIAASQAREMELERALQLALSVARRAERRAEVERPPPPTRARHARAARSARRRRATSPAADDLGADGLVESLSSALTLRRSGFAKENRFMEAAGAMESRRRALRRRLGPRRRAPRRGGARARRASAPS